MSISPPLDIVLDVAKAADPVRYREAVAKLARVSAPEAGKEFGTFLDPLHTAASGDGEKPAPLPESPVFVKPAGPDPAKVYRDFEALTLTAFIESAFPKDGSAVFGEGTAGGVWKSMLAEKIAAEMAKAGGIGLAQQLAAHEALTGGVRPGPSAAKDSPLDPALLVMTAERGFAETLRADETSA